MGGWKFLLLVTEKKNSAKKCSWGLEMQKKKIFNVPGVLKRTQQICFGGGDFGVFGAPHAPTRGSRGVGKRYTSSYDHDP